MILTPSLNNALVTGSGSGEHASGLTPEEHEMLKTLWQFRGFDINNNTTISDTQISVDGKVVEIDNTNPNQTVLRRTT